MTKSFDIGPADEGNRNVKTSNQEKHAHFDQDQVPLSPGQQEDDRDQLSSASDEDSRPVEVCHSASLALHAPNHTNQPVITKGLLRSNKPLS